MCCCFDYKKSYEYITTLCMDAATGTPLWVSGRPWSGRPLIGVASADSLVSYDTEAVGLRSDIRGLSNGGFLTSHVSDVPRRVNGLPVFGNGYSPIRPSELMFSLETVSGEFRKIGRVKNGKYTGADTFLSAEFSGSNTGFGYDQRDCWGIFYKEAFGGYRVYRMPGKELVLTVPTAYPVPDVPSWALGGKYKALDTRIFDESWNQVGEMQAIPLTSQVPTPGVGIGDYLIASRTSPSTWNAYDKDGEDIGVLSVEYGGKSLGLTTDRKHFSITQTSSVSLYDENTELVFSVSISPNVAHVQGTWFVVDGSLVLASTPSSSGTSYIEKRNPDGTLDWRTTVPSQSNFSRVVDLLYWKDQSAIVVTILPTLYANLSANWKL